LGSGTGGQVIANRFRRNSVCARRSGARERGFTLIEVIVALAMLSIGLSVLLGLISNGLRQAKAAEKAAEASTLAQSLLAEVGTDRPVKQGAFEETMPNGFRWHLRIQPYGAAAEQEGLPVGLYLVSTEVEWQDGAEQRSFALKTLRLGPAEKPK
jgi:general secretion pathway protein I